MEHFRTFARADGAPVARILVAWLTVITMAIPPLILAVNAAIF